MSKTSALQCRYLIWFILTACCWMSGPLTLTAQKIEEFSENRNTFLKELGDHITASRNSRTIDNFKKFDRYAGTGLFRAEDLARIRKTCNIMLHQRVPVSPYYSEYLNVLCLLKTSQVEQIVFDTWNNIVDSLLDDVQNRRFSGVQEFLAFSAGFFEKQAIRYSDLGTSWLCKGAEFQLEYVNKAPVVRFRELDLTAKRGSDSIVIQRTGGTYYPLEHLWRGQGGIVTWERLDLNSDVFVELGSYQLETKKSLYTVENARLHYPLYFGEEMVEGIFSDKLVSQNPATEGSYPRFQSAENLLEISNFGEGIQFIGGFRMEGTTVYGFGTADQKATLLLRNKKEIVSYYGQAELFTIKQEERIIGESVESILYFGQDSIYHPSVNVRFEIPTRELQLSRGKRGNDRNPFFLSLSKVNVDVERIDFMLDQDSIYIGRRNFGFAKSSTSATFESLKYFQESEYFRLQNISTTNPIALLKLISQEVDDRVLDANLLARKLNPNFSIENITSLLYDLVSKGFINYDAATETVELKDKIFHYADASQKKVDFDIIKIVSESDETNAIFNLRDNTTSIMGVSQVELSRAQRVLIRPYGNFVKLKPNRDMDLEGLLFAGFSTLHGKDFHFDYNSFQIQLDSVRYFDLYLPTGTLDKFSMPNAYSIGSRIEHLNGVLLIDAPSNKSGRENISIFPILESKKNSYVFYDYKGTQAGAYDRKTFYFELDPFSFNSLDNYSKDDIRLKGKFLSADIFPVFHETLIIREDTSLGFITQTPTTGFRVYRNKGNYNGALELSNRGLLGRGNLSYLSASIDSKDLVFKPLQLTGSAESFNLKEDRSGQVEVPEVNGSDVTIDWRPYKDSMYIFSKQAPFEIFNQGIHEIKGMLILTPGGLKASGLLNWDKASMESNLFSLGAFSAQADTTDLKIKAFNADALALTTENLNGNVDFDKQMGNFSANANLLTTTLPYNQYQTSFNEFDWNMANETVTFRALEGNLGNFLSIHPDQDSLSFQGKSAFYDLRTNQLKIGGVPYIITSDAYIYPDSGNVDIQPNAEMKTLTNARIVADTVSKYHVINRASVQILGKKEYRASGFYEYNIGRHQQEIEFGEIIGSRIGKGSRSEKRSVTRANGEIGQRSDFYIDHKTKFHGTISLSSDKPNLRFKGFGQLQSSSLPEQNWFSFNCEGDKNNLTIIYDFPLNMEGEQLHTGLYISKETASVYPRVMMPLYFRKDRPIISIKGALQFDEKNDRFIFSDTSLLFGGSNHLDGNQLVFNNKNGNIEMAGKLEFGSALKYIDVDAAGFVQTDFPGMEVDSFFDAGSLESKLNIQAMVGIKLILPENLEKIMLADFKSSTFEASPIVYARNMSYYKKVVSELFPKNEDMRDVIDEINLGSLNLPKRFNPYTVLFDNVPLVWDRDYQSFVSTTDNLGIASITGDMVSMNVTAYLEMKMPTNEDDRLYFYIKSPSQQYYFFGYKQGILNVFSNNTRFMDELLSMKDKEKVFKMADGEQYEIQPVEPSTVQAFINRVKAAVPN